MSRADAAARALAVREFERPVILEAGAGTGKTRTLVARIGTWILGPGWERARAELAAERALRPPLAPRGAGPEDDEIAARAAEGVVAITFTDAAAAEMRGRVARLLAQAAAGEPIDDLERLPAGVDRAAAARRGAHLLACAGRLAISTIHGFCHRLLAENALEAGLHPAFAVDPEKERLTELATRLLLERLRTADAGLVGLLARGVDPPQLLEATTALAAAGVDPDDLERDPFDDDLATRLLDEIAAALPPLLAAAAPLRQARRVARIHDGLDAVASLRDALAGVERSVAGLESVRGALAEALETASKPLGEWAAGTFGKTEEKALGPALPALEAAAHRAAESVEAAAELDVELHRAARRALAPLLRELRARLRAEGVLSFDDLLERAVALLERRPGVLRRARRAIRQLMVDEFQDTDRRQCDLVRRLILDASSAPPPGLLVVGDPKQSIYGWRSADLAAYVDLVDELVAAGAARGRLEVNFRSVEPILAEVERSLAPVLVEERGIQAPFEPLRVSERRRGEAGFDAAGRRPVEFWASWDAERLAAEKRTTAARAAQLEAEAIASDIAGLVGSGLARPGDFALLLRSRGDLDAYLDAFRRASVPYAVQRDRSYYRRREIVDSAAAVRAVLDPADLLALVAFLRSPFVGVPDRAWLPLWESGFPAAMLELGADGGERAERCVAAAAESLRAVDAGDELGAWPQSLLEAVRAIAALRRDFPRLGAARWVERLRSRLLFEPVAAARYLGRFGVANLERLFSDLERSLDVADPARALAALRAAVAEESAAEEARPPEPDADAVAVMTIHTAKGLQFRHVYLAQAHRVPGGRGRDALGTVAVGPAGEGGRELVLFGTPSPGWREHARSRARVAHAESARVLYVAMTRAADRLVVLGAFDPDGEKEPAPARTPSFAQLLGGRLAPAAALEPEQPEALDAWRARWRLAAPAAESGSTAAGEPTEEPPRPEFDEAAWVARRAAAASRAARPRIAAPSSATIEAPLPAASGDGARTGARARALGVAVHRALELRHLADEDPPAWSAAVARTWAEALSSAGIAPATADPGELDAALARLLESNLWRSLGELGSRVVARELPLMVAAEPGETPTGGWAGALDLLYRDAASGALVVADFKTDRIEDAAADEHAALHRRQLTLYGRAVERALGLERAPRLELWLTGPDRVVVVAPERETADSG